MQILNILKYPNPELLKKSAPVKPEEIPGLLTFIKDLTFTMKQNKGIGIAAPQVGQKIRLIVVNSEGKPIVLINPEIVKFSKEMENDEEGCLSVPAQFGYVPRAKSIKVKALNEKGKKLNFTAKGLFARVIQHETDHLDGVLFIEKTLKTTDNNIL